MDTEEKNKRKLQKFLTAMDENSMTNEEFFKQFEQIFKIFLAMKVANEKQISTIVNENSLQMQGFEKKLQEKMATLSIDGLETEMRGKMKMMMKDCQVMIKTVDDKINSVEDGMDADEEKIIAEITKTIPKIEDIEKDLPKLGTSIRDGLELLVDNERLDKSAVKGFDEVLLAIKRLEEELKKIRDAKFSSSNFIGGGVSKTPEAFDLSSKTNGVLKTFSVPGLSKALFVMSSDFPTVLMLNNGFTYSATTNTITLQTDNAPSSGSQLLFMFQP